MVGYPSQRPVSSFQDLGEIRGCLCALGEKIQLGDGASPGMVRQEIDFQRFYDLLGCEAQGGSMTHVLFLRSISKFSQGGIER